MAAPGPEDDADLDSASASPSTLKLLAHYLMLGFGPFVAVLALMFALISIIRVPAIQAKVNAAETRAHKLEAALNASRLEVINLQNALLQEKNARVQDDSRQTKLMAQIIQNVTQVQTRLKIHPTLEQQMGQPEAAANEPATTVPKAATGAKNGKPEAGGQAKAMLDAIRQFNKQ